MPDELPASVVVAIVESIRSRGMNAFIVEDVAVITGLDPITIHDRWAIKRNWRCVPSVRIVRRPSHPRYRFLP